MIVPPTSLCFSADYAILAELRGFIGRVASEVGLEARKVEALVLAADEAATNIIAHAAVASPCDIVCSMGSSEDGTAVICELVYTAQAPFIPLDLPSPRDIQDRVRALKRGGLGVYLTHTLVDEIEYRRDGDENLIRLRSFVR